MCCIMATEYSGMLFIWHFCILCSNMHACMQKQGISTYGESQCNTPEWPNSFLLVMNPIIYLCSAFYFLSLYSFNIFIPHFFFKLFHTSCSHPHVSVFAPFLLFSSCILLTMRRSWIWIILHLHHSLLPPKSPGSNPNICSGSTFCTACIYANITVYATSNLTPASGVHMIFLNIDVIVVLL